MNNAQVLVQLANSPAVIILSIGIACAVFCVAVGFAMWLTDHT